MEGKKESAEMGDFVVFPFEDPVAVVQQGQPLSSPSPALAGGPGCTRCGPRSSSKPIKLFCSKILKINMSRFFFLSPTCLYHLLLFLFFANFPFGFYFHKEYRQIIYKHMSVNYKTYKHPCLSYIKPIFFTSKTILKNQ